MHYAFPRSFRRYDYVALNPQPLPPGPPDPDPVPFVRSYRTPVAARSSIVVGG